VANLRRAGIADAAHLVRLRGLLLTAMGADTSDPQWAQACEQAFVRRLAEPDRFAAWVVDVDGRPVSSGVAWVEEHLPSPSALDGRRAHLASMATEPQHRRQGHGQAVLEALLGWCTSVGMTRVDLRATPDGRRLYERAGFRELGGAALSWTAAPLSRP
jgi:GNAT superfamily N-acetyltransferase